MASSQEDGAAATAQQLGSMSLRESVGKKDNDAEPTTKNGTPSKLSCSACGEKSNTLMKCRACKCVWYCDKKCQNKHWKVHKKECKRIKKELDERGGKLDVGTELDIGRLPDLPSQEECPICMRVLPIHPKLQGYAACCGKTICGSCNYQHQMQSKERAAEKGQTSVLPSCVFCRTDVPVSNEEVLAQLHKRVGLNDSQALVNLAMNYGRGDFGLPVDRAKCIALLREAADLGFPDAQYQLGCYYANGEMGLEQNQGKATKYWKKAAEGGDVHSRHNLGCTAIENGDAVAAMRRWRLAASGGFKISMKSEILCFEKGLLHHGDLAETLQAFYRSRGEMKSEDRDQYIAYLKMTGKYKEEYDL